MCVCVVVCVCMHTCMYACMYMCVHIHVCFYVYLSMWTHLERWTYMCVHVCAYLCACVHLCICVGTHVCFSVCMCVLTWRGEHIWVWRCMLGPCLSLWLLHLIFETEPLIKPGAHQLARPPILQAPRSSCAHLSAYIFVSASRMLQVLGTVTDLHTWAIVAPRTSWLHVGIYGVSGCCSKYIVQT